MFTRVGKKAMVLIKQRVSHANMKKGDVELCVWGSNVAILSDNFLLCVFLLSRIDLSVRNRSCPCFRTKKRDAIPLIFKRFKHWHGLRYSIL